MNNVIFIHVAILPGHKERINQYLDIIESSNLLLNIYKIYICYIGNDFLKIEDLNITNELIKEKINIKKLSNNLNDYELPTLQFLYNFCIENSSYNVLYLHTKNVGKEINLCIEDQIEYMLYFLITKWKICIEKLYKYHTCGVDLRHDPTIHYSGNFWWSTSNNINSLPNPIEFNNIEKYPNPLNSLRHNHEFWICYNKDIDKYWNACSHIYR